MNRMNALQSIKNSISGERFQHIENCLCKLNILHLFSIENDYDQEYCCLERKEENYEDAVF